MTPSPVIVLSAEDQRRAPYAYALRDLVGGLRLVQLWGAMAWFDIRQRYSRSIIGPFWTTLSLAAMVGGLGLVYGTLFKVPLLDFLPYLAVGMLVWTFLVGMLLEGCGAFVAAEVAIKQMPVPLSVHVYRLVWRALIVFAHNAIVVLVLLLARPLTLLAGLVPALAGVLLIALNGVAAALMLGTLAARFRDLTQLVVNLSSMVFFVSPILWRADSLGERAWIAYANPIYHFVEIVRAPLLGDGLPLASWGFAALFTALNIAVAFWLFARFRWRIPYWI